MTNQPKHNYIAGKAYKMRNGEKAVFVGIKPFTEKTLLFVYEYPNTVNEHTIDGRYWSFNDNHPNDIIGEWPPEPRKFNGWINIYTRTEENGQEEIFFRKIFSTKDAALRNSVREKLVACIPIEFTEGEGL